MQRYHILNRVYENIATGKRSELYAEVLEGVDHVTLATEFICPIPKTQCWKNDPFLETRTVDPETLDRLNGVKAKKGGLDDLIAAICNTIVEVWDPSKTHVVFHSSGYDSRVLSTCIRKLYRERGSGWLGEVLFLSNRWESSAFYEIMRLQGWKRSQYAAYDEGSAEDHYGRVLDFKRYWYTNNVPVPQVGSLMSYLIEWAQEKGLLPSNEHLQSFNGHGCALGGNDREGLWIMRLNPEATAAKIWSHGSHNYYSASMLNFPSNSHTNFVLAEERVVNAGLGYDTKKPMRQAICNRLCPEIGHIPNMGKSDNFHDIGEAVKRKAESDFANSHYAKITGTTWESPPQSSWDPRWAIWGLASLVEHLHELGIEIRRE